MEAHLWCVLFLGRPRLGSIEQTILRNSVAQLPKTCLVAKNLPRGDYFVDHSDPVSLVGPMGLFGLVGQNSLIHNVHTYPTPTFEPKLFRDSHRFQNDRWKMGECADRRRIGGKMSVREGCLGVPAEIRGRIQTNSQTLLI